MKKVPLLILFALAVSFAVTRAPLSSVGPVAETLRSALMIDYKTFGIVTALPVFCFGAFGFVTPWLFARLSGGKALCVVLAALSFGLFLRTLESVAALLIGTLFVGAGIAMINTIIPVILRHYYPDKVSFALGVCTASVGLSSFLGAALAYPMQEITGSYTGALGVWLLFAIPAAIAWFMAKPEDLPDLRPTKKSNNSEKLALVFLPSLSVVTTVSLQAVCTFAVIGWLPALLMSVGVSEAVAGNALAGLLVVAFLASLAISFLIRVTGGERNLSILLTLSGLASLPLWFMGGIWPFVGCFLMALPHGARYSLAIILIAKKARTLPQMVLLSSLAQGLGYLTASVGPFVCGLLYSGDGDWSAVLIFLAATIILWGVAAFYGFGSCDVFRRTK